MKRDRIAILCAAAIALTMLAACGGTPGSGSSAAESPGSAASSVPSSSAPASSGAQSASAPSSAPAAYAPDWRVEPYLEAAQITGLPEDTAELNQQMVFSHLGIQQEEGGGWQFLNFETAHIFPEQQSAAGFWATCSGSLPFFDGGTFDFGMEYNQLEEWVGQLSAEEGIGLDYQGHGTANVNPPVLAGGEWLQYFVYPEGLSAFDPSRPLSFSGAANVALYLELDDADWQASSDPIRWMYVGGEGGSDYDGVILVDQDGERLDDVIYEDGQPYREGVAAVKQGGLWGYVDETGAPITDFCFEPMLSNDGFSREASVPYSANEGLIPVKRGGKCGVIDTAGNEVVPCMFEGITSVYNGAVWAKLDGKWGVLNVA